MQKNQLLSKERQLLTGKGKAYDSASGANRNPPRDDYQGPGGIKIYADSDETWSSSGLVISTWASSHLDYKKMTKESNGNNMHGNGSTSLSR